MQERPRSDAFKFQRTFASEAIAAWRRLLNLNLGDRFPRHTRLFDQGTAANTLFLIEEGLIKLTYLQADGKETILGLRVPGQFAEYCSAELATKYFASGETITETRVHKVQTEQLSRVLSGNIEAAALFRTQETADLLNACIEVVSLKGESAERRFERLLWQLAIVQEKEAPGDFVRVDGLLSNVELAALISISPEHLSRLKHRMLKNGRLQREGNAILFSITRPQRDR